MKLDKGFYVCSLNLIRSFVSSLVIGKGRISVLIKSEVFFVCFFHFVLPSVLLIGIFTITITIGFTIGIFNRHNLLN